MTKSKLSSYKKQIRADLAYWQRELRLVDWDLSITFSDKLSDDVRYSEVDPFPEDKYAEIVIQHPSMWGGKWDEIVNEDMDAVKFKLEVLVVHELLHLHIGWYRPYGQDEVLDLLDEQAIETLSKLLVKLKNDNEER